MKTKNLLVGLGALLISGCTTDSGGQQASTEALLVETPSAQAADSNTVSRAKTHGSKAVYIEISKRKKPTSPGEHSPGGDADLQAPCTVAGDGFSRSFTSPSQVSLPTYQSDNYVKKPISLRCTVDGKVHEQTYSTTNLTGKQRAVGAGLASGLLCGSVCQQAAMARAMRPQAGDVYGYDPILHIVK